MLLVRFSLIIFPPIADSQFGEPIEVFFKHVGLIHSYLISTEEDRQSINPSLFKLLLSFAGQMVARLLELF